MLSGRRGPAPLCTPEAPPRFKQALKMGTPAPRDTDLLRAVAVLDSGFLVTTLNCTKTQVIQ